MIALFQTAFLEFGVIALEEFFVGWTDGLDKGWAADAENDGTIRWRCE